jgi:hypothetical protein
MFKYLLVSFLVMFAGLTATAQDKAVSLDFSGWNAPGLEAYQGNEKSFLVTLQNAGAAWDVTGTPPIMWWAVDNASASVVTAACTVVTATSGVFRATFYPADLNTYGTFIYGVSVTSNNVTTARQGQFVIRRDPYAVGGSPVQYGTNMNFGLISRYISTLGSGPYLFTGTGVSTTTNAKGQVVATITAGSGGISASTATSIVQGIAYPLAGNPSNYITLAEVPADDLAWTSKVDTVTLGGYVATGAVGTAAYSNANAFATSNQGALADGALPKAATNGAEWGSHGGLVATNNTTYTQTVAQAASAVQSVHNGSLTLTNGAMGVPQLTLNAVDGLESSAIRFVYGGTTQLLTYVDAIGFNIHHNAYTVNPVLMWDSENFIAGINYLAPNGSGSSLTSLDLNPSLTATVAKAAAALTNITASQIVAAGGVTNVSTVGTPTSVVNLPTNNITKSVINTWPIGEGAMTLTNNTFLTFSGLATNDAGSWAMSITGTNTVTVDPTIIDGWGALVWTNSLTVPNDLFFRKTSGSMLIRVR